MRRTLENRDAIALVALTNNYAAGGAEDGGAFVDAGGGVGCSGGTVGEGVGKAGGASFVLAGTSFVMDVLRCSVVGDGVFVSD